MNNCLSCKYEPVWKDDGGLYGECRFPLPLALIPKPFMLVLESHVKEGKFDNCPAHESKED